MRAQVCKDVRCEDWPGAGGWEATTPNFPDLSPAVLKATWKDTQHTSSPGRRGGRGSRQTEDRELRLRVTGNYFKSLLEAALLSQRGRLILRVALPQVADTLACTHA